MQVKIKKLNKDAIIPFYAREGDAGLDLVAIDINETDMYIEYKTGLAIEIPSGYVGLIFPRSSISKYMLMLKNSVGVIDSGYRGEITLRFQKLTLMYEEVTDFSKLLYKKGDKIGQLIILPYPRIEFVEVNELSLSDRGVAGYGSTG